MPRAFYSVPHRRRREKASEPLGVVAPAARLTSCLMRVDWPAQPYRNLAQRLFQQYFIKCFSRASPTGIGRTSWRAGSKCHLRVAPPWRQLRTAYSKITSVPSGNGRGRRTEWRASNVKWKDDTRPPAYIFPTIIFLIYIAREIALQDHRAEIVAEEAAHSELALLLIA